MLDRSLIEHDVAAWALNRCPAPAMIEIELGLPQWEETIPFEDLG